MKVLAAGVVATAGAASFSSLVASAPQAAAAATPHRTYKVVAGDTLSKIAARFGVSVAELSAANDISNTNFIVVGQTLVIPTSTGVTTTSTHFQTYTVRSGDTLSSIAQRFGMTLSEIASINHIDNVNLIYVGQQLQVAGGGGGSTHTTVPSTYTVRAGDTLSEIASRFGTTVDHLAEINHLANPNQIYVGEVLRISGSGGGGGGGGGNGGGGSHTSIQAVAVRVALAQVGKPYQWGGAGPNSFDCSGLVMYAYAQAGVSLPHYTVSQYDDTARISQAQLEPGDLVFYDNYDGPQPGHVAMYIGNGQVVAANTTGDPVQTQSLSYDGTIIGFGRVSG